MEQNQLEQKITDLSGKIDKLQATITKLYRLFFWMLMITIVLFVLPLIGLAFVIPQFMDQFSQYGSLGY